MIISVIDGMGRRYRRADCGADTRGVVIGCGVLALGANAIATQKMMQARASRGASGENAIRLSVGRADFILASIGAVVPDFMMGEITQVVAQAGRGVFFFLPGGYGMCEANARRLRCAHVRRRTRVR